jgi:hypothetical protein
MALELWSIKGDLGSSAEVRNRPLEPTQPVRRSLLGRGLRTHARKRTALCSLIQKTPTPSLTGREVFSILVFGIPQATCHDTEPRGMLVVNSVLADCHHC